MPHHLETVRWDPEDATWPGSQGRKTVLFGWDIAPCLHTHLPFSITVKLGDCEPL